MYYTGNGVEKCDEMAVFWFKKSAEQGNAFAQYLLGSCLENGQGIAQDLDEAVLWYEKAAAQGHEGAMEKIEGEETKKREK